MISHVTSHHLAHLTRLITPTIHPIHPNHQILSYHPTHSHPNPIIPLPHDCFIIPPTPTHQGSIPLHHSSISENYFKLYAIQ